MDGCAVVPEGEVKVRVLEKGGDGYSQYEGEEWRVS